MGIGDTSAEPEGISGGAVYADTVWRVGGVLGHVEAWLGSLPNGEPITPARALAEAAPLSTVHDRMILALAALEALGVLTRRSDAMLLLDRERLGAAHLFRVGVGTGVRHAESVSRVSEVPRLVAALPLGLPTECIDAMRNEADDLRADLINLVSGAREDVILASPFWDDDTVADLESLLRRRLDAGVRIAVLGRRPSADQPRPAHGFAHLPAVLGRYPRFRALVWEEPLSGDPLTPSHKFPDVRGPQSCHLPPCSCFTVSISMFQCVLE